VKGFLLHPKKLPSTTSLGRNQVLKSQPFTSQNTQTRNPKGFRVSSFHLIFNHSLSYHTPASERSKQLTRAQAHKFFLPIPPKTHTTSSRLLHINQLVVNGHIDTFGAPKRQGNTSQTIRPLPSPKCKGQGHPNTNRCEAAKPTIFFSPQSI
jgi:hypothetical protein